jgi:hypothetical protein
VFYRAAADTAIVLLSEKHDFHKLFMHQTWLGDEGRYLLAFRIHNSKLTKTVVTTSWLWTAV